MSDIKWQDPPPDRTGWSVWGETADALRKRPGEWALVREGSKTAGLAGNIASGRLACFRPTGSFEAVTRKREDGTADIYARFVGEPS